MFANISQNGIVPHNSMTLCEFICVQCQFYHQALTITIIDRGQILFREFDLTKKE